MNNFKSDYDFLVNIPSIESYSSLSGFLNSDDKIEDYKVKNFGDNKTEFQIFIKFSVSLTLFGKLNTVAYLIQQCNELNIKLI